MRLDSRAFGLAAATIAAALFSVCALAVAVAPAWSTAVASSLIHLDLSDMARTITWGTFLTGLLWWSVGTGIAFAAAGGLYNLYATRTGSAAGAGLPARRAA